MLLFNRVLVQLIVFEKKSFFFFQTMFFILEKKVFFSNNVFFFLTEHIFFFFKKTLTVIRGRQVIKNLMVVIFSRQGLGGHEEHAAVLVFEHRMGVLGVRRPHFRFFFLNNRKKKTMLD